MYQRPGRKVWYASLDHEHKHISLGTEDEATAKVEFAKLLERCRIRELAPTEESLVEIFAIARERAATNGTPKSAYERHLNLRRVLGWLDARGIYGPRRVDKQVVEDYKTARRFDGVSAARINAELVAWRRAWAIAEERKQVPKHHGDEIFEKLREPQRDPHRKVHSKKQLDAFLRAVDARYRPLFRAVLGCGLRDEEMRHLRAEDVRRSEVSVTPQPGWSTKGYRYRTIPISPATRKALLAWLETRASLNADKKKVWLVARAGALAAAVPPLSLHDLRHAWASHLYHGGVPIKTLSMWLGHRDAATTERYLGVVSAEMPKGTKLPW